ncbi:MAG TPA: hypothetical protein VK944_06750, partial [Candidatus Limnocylindria bacterium]|nr:hypothetical protein [Candidatus Limnocylindria bacterium]
DVGYFRQGGKQHPAGPSLGQPGPVISRLSLLVSTSPSIGATLLEPTGVDFSFRPEDHFRQVLAHMTPQLIHAEAAM